MSGGREGRPMGGLLILPLERSTDDFEMSTHSPPPHKPPRANPDSCGNIQNTTRYTAMAPDRFKSFWRD
jgi:hypothetical protein